MTRAAAAYLMLVTFMGLVSPPLADYPGCRGGAAGTCPLLRGRILYHQNERNDTPPRRAVSCDSWLVLVGFVDSSGSDHPAERLAECSARPYGSPASSFASYSVTRALALDLKPACADGFDAENDLHRAKRGVASRSIAPEGLSLLEIARSTTSTSRAPARDRWPVPRATSSSMRRTSSASRIPVRTRKTCSILPSA